MKRSEYNLAIHSNVDDLLGFACIADLQATACILACLPVYDSEFMTVSKEGYIVSVKDHGAHRELNSINWHIVETKLDEYLERTDAQQWIKHRKDLFMLLIHDVIGWMHDKEDIRDALSKENLRKYFFREDCT